MLQVYRGHSYQSTRNIARSAFQGYSYYSRRNNNWRGRLRRRCSQLFWHVTSWPLANRVIPRNGRTKCLPQSVLLIVTNRRCSQLFWHVTSLLAPFQCLAASINSCRFRFSTVAKCCSNLGGVHSCFDTWPPCWRRAKCSSYILTYHSR